MGILNVTPDSFYAGSRVQEEEQLLMKAQEMVSDGAAILDIGGYSTRPGAEDISPSQEIERVVSAIKTIRQALPNTLISIDTFRASVATEAIAAGASLINDVSGGNLDPLMFETVASLKVPYILMHMRGTPQTMKSLAEYENVVPEVYQELQTKLNRLHQLGVADVIIDPGFGFAKTIEHNFRLLRNLRYFKALGQPVLAGVSRKSMIYKTLDITPENALNGTTALHMAALEQGASLLRVHDVKAAMECVQLHHKLNA